MGRPKGAKDLTPRERKSQGVCLICGLTTLTVRAEARTCSNRCRSALRRFRLLYGCEPVRPINGTRIRPVFWGRENWYLKYLPRAHPLNQKHNGMLAEVRAAAPKTHQLRTSKKRPRGG